MTLIKILLKHGADHNKMCNRVTPLDFALVYKMIPLIELLLYKATIYYCSALFDVINDQSIINFHMKHCIMLYVVVKVQ